MKIFLTTSYDWKTDWPVVDILKNLNPETLILHCGGKRAKILRLYGPQYGIRMGDCSQNDHNKKALDEVFYNDPEYVFLFACDSKDKLITDIRELCIQQQTYYIFFDLSDIIHTYTLFQGESELLVTTKAEELIEYITNIDIQNRFSFLLDDMDIKLEDPHDIQAQPKFGTPEYYEKLDQSKELLIKKKKEIEKNRDSNQIKFYDPALSALQRGRYIKGRWKKEVFDDDIGNIKKSVPQMKPKKDSPLDRFLRRR